MKISNIRVDEPGLTLVHALPTGSDCGFVVLAIDELFADREPHGLIGHYEAGKIVGTLVSGNCSAVWGQRQGSESVAWFLGEDGEIWVYQHGRIDEHAALRDDFDIEGPLRSLCQDGQGRMLAAGACLQLYAGENCRSWRTFEPLLGDESVEPYRNGIEAMTPIADTSVIAVGWRGQGFEITGDSASRLNLPTNLDLFDVCCDNGLIYACGDQGIVLRGDGERWEVIVNDLTDDKLWSIRSFHGRVFVCSMRELFEIQNSSLVLVNRDAWNFSPTSLYRLRVGGGVLWSAGEKELAQFNGTDWVPLLNLA